MSSRRLVPWTLAVLVTATGCTAAGMAAGPVLTAISIVSDRSVERTVAADLTTAWAATLDALSRMAVRIDESDRKDEAWTLKGTGETVTVHAKLARVTPVMTRVSLRVETGGITADKKTGEEILNQVAGTLTAASAAWAASAERSAASERLDALHREIQRLGSKLDDKREAPSAPAPGPATPAGPAIAPGRIIVIPTSAGLPSLPASGGTPMTEPRVADPLPAKPTTPAAVAGGDEVRGAKQGPDVEAQARAQDATVAAPLTPAGVLRPVEPLGAKRSGQ